MSSQRKIDSARANGAKSRGPITPEGKRASALNGLKHGLTAEIVVLPTESPEEFNALLLQYLDHFRPCSQPEHDLVRQLATAQWRITRYAGVETALLAKKMDEMADRIAREYVEIDDQTRVAMAFESLCGGNGTLALLSRYQSRLHHEYQRTLKSLLQMQSARQARAAKLPTEPNPDFEQRPHAPVEPTPAPNRSPNAPRPNGIPPIPGIASSPRTDLPPVAPPSWSLMHPIPL